MPLSMNGCWMSDIDAGNGALCVACSGGLDSTVLLHLLSELPAARRRGLRALHVDHALHPQSAAWAEAVRQRCNAWQLPCQIIEVQLAERHGLGLEAAAREARYRAFTESLQAGETLLLAHHRDDQVETVLLKLLRGAGPEGLRGMRERRPLGAGTLWRPLLGVAHAELAAYAQAQGLIPIEDPANRDTRLARNFLRHRLLPALRSQWPQAADAILQAARCCGDAADALQHIWRQHYAELHDPTSGSLAATAWLALPPALRVPLLHHWLYAQKLTAPSTAQCAEIERQIHVRDGRIPQIRWQNTELHIWRERLWAQPLNTPPPADWRQRWQGESLLLPGGGHWTLIDLSNQSLPPLELRLRQGGERIRLAGETHQRNLSDLLQQAGVPPWRRRFVPMLYQNGELIAAGAHWRSAQAQALFDASGGWEWRPPRGIDSGIAPGLACAP